MDGRAQMPVIQWIQREYGLDYIDMITEAGMDGVLAEDDVEAGIIEKINISLDKHNSEMIFIVGHFDCAGNPVDNATHKKNICSAVDELKSQIDHYNIVGLWVSEKWKVKKIYEQ